MADLHESERRPAGFVLWRQDDNGNLFVVGTYADRATAERQLALLSRSLHKQTYWIAEQKGDMNETDTTGNPAKER